MNSVEAQHSPPSHRPGNVTTRPRGILKNPSFSGSAGQYSPTRDESPAFPPATPLDPEEAKEITLHNTLQNAGHRRSSSAARRTSVSRRHSSIAQAEPTDEQMRLKWDEANLYLHEQEAGGRMKITEPKTPYQFGGDAMEEDEEEDVSIDPRFVNVDEFDLAQKKHNKKPRESEIPEMELGEPEDEGSGAQLENDRIFRSSSLSRDNSKEKHVNLSSDSDAMQDGEGASSREEEEKHKQFEERRKAHYEMRSVKGLLGHPENDEMEDDDDDIAPNVSARLPSRGINGTA